MYADNTLKKIPWITNATELFDGNILVSKRLDQLSEKTQKYLVYQAMLTLSQYFSQIPDHQSTEPNQGVTSLDIIKSLKNTLPTWISGLSDLSVSRIVNGLLNIINLKTEYQKWPPKSVMEFYAVCKKDRVPYHEPYKKINGLLQIEHNKENSEKIAEKTMAEIFKMMGRDYEKFKRKIESNKKCST